MSAWRYSVVFPLLAVALADAAPDLATRSLIDGGHFKQARLVLEPRVKANPSDAEAAALLSHVRAAFGDRDGALALAEMAVKLEPKVAGYHWQLAQVVGQFSPDGKWIAFQSNESSRFEVYVQPFPGSGNRSTISTNGGAQVRWRHDGKELFYIALDGRLMAVAVRPASNGQVLEPDTPVALFQTRVGGAVPSVFRQMYMVSAGGRFLMNTVVEEAASPMTLILAWKGQR